MSVISVLFVLVNFSARSCRGIEAPSGRYLPPPPRPPSNHYLPPPTEPPRSYLPPPTEPPNSYLPPRQGRFLSLAEPVFNNRLIYFEHGQFINKATEPGVCEAICPGGSATTKKWYKPGTCPKPHHHMTSKRACKEECTYDSECPGKERCCNNGCAYVCVLPDEENHGDDKERCAGVVCPKGSVCVKYSAVHEKCVDTSAKPDQCPAIMDDMQPIGGCQDMCKYDAECDGTAKCCHNGCAMKCLQPKKSGCDTFACKVGYQCIEKTRGKPICERMRCEHNGEVIDVECNSCTCIQGYLLCSQKHCPPTKPGFCPRIVKGYKGKCVEQCTMDSNCPGDRKCCSTGCGNTCQKPATGITHPCKTVRFRCGGGTICAAVRGLCQPGKKCPLQPLCVGKNVPYCATCPAGKVCVLQKQKCPNGGDCARQPICIQLYDDHTLFDEHEDVQVAEIQKNQGKHYDEGLFF